MSASGHLGRGLVDDVCSWRMKNPQMGAYPRCSAYSCKNLQPSISRKSAEIPSTIQTTFPYQECGSSNPPKSARQSLS